ncbi:MAG: Flp family type IVb pilin [Methylocystaceae bacterium]
MMRDKLKSWWSDETGQGMVEYGLILVLISVAILSLLTDIGQDMVARFTTIGSALK